MEEKEIALLLINKESKKRYITKSTNIESINKDLFDFYKIINPTVEYNIYYQKASYLPDDIELDESNKLAFIKWKIEEVTEEEKLERVNAYNNTVRDKIKEFQERPICITINNELYEILNVDLPIWFDEENLSLLENISIPTYKYKIEEFLKDNDIKNISGDEQIHKEFCMFSIIDIGAKEFINKIKEAKRNTYIELYTYIKENLINNYEALIDKIKKNM